MADTRAFLERGNLQSLIDTIRDAGYRCVGPQSRDGAIVFDTLTHVDQLPRGVTADQGPGSYRLGHGGGQRFFAWANGPQALKPLTFRPRETLWRVLRDRDDRLHFEAADAPVTKTAVIGARACDLAALYIQDKHFLQGECADPSYRAARQELFIVAVHCTHAAATCFCASTGDGPRAAYGFDIALTELNDGFVVEVLSSRGRDLAAGLETAPATPVQLEAAAAAVAAAAEAQSRALPAGNLRNLLFARLEHPRWEQVAERCLACGNCTSVCPTCFCSAEHEVPSLDGSHSERTRSWDSCFNESHGRIHGLNVRAATSQRYRQWLTHKLAGWHDQYGRSGCVGCGRCISWCPVGIDITEEAAAICA
ncbi:MAG: 4Fe-4S dicluster domain-containing protein [Gammaproteobacteria bacterium]|nr:4Fe-4S dicluster domain-containing protein [Gammaproteobacteria bacterium]